MSCRLPILVDLEIVIRSASVKCEAVANRHADIEIMLNPPAEGGKLLRRHCLSPQGRPPLVSSLRKAQRPLVHPGQIMSISSSCQWECLECGGGSLRRARPCQAPCSQAARQGHDEDAGPVSRRVPAHGVAAILPKVSIISAPASSPRSQRAPPRRTPSRPRTEAEGWRPGEKLGQRHALSGASRKWGLSLLSQELQDRPRAAGGGPQSHQGEPPRMTFLATAYPSAWCDRMVLHEKS